MKDLNFIKKHPLIKNIKNFNFIKKLIKQYPKAQFYLVGGAIRDIILKQSNITDIDFVFCKIPQEQLIKSLKPFGDVNLVGKNFGVIKLRSKKLKKYNEIDIALPRTEKSIYKTGARKDFNITSNPYIEIKEDLKRRDFTINSIAYDLKSNNIIDPFNGIKDIKQRLIKTVLTPKKRFREDYSRLLRAIRFACQFNFKIEKNTKQEIEKMAKHVNSPYVSKDLAGNEINKTFYYNASHALKLFDNTNILKQILPETFATKKKIIVINQNKKLNNKQKDKKINIFTTTKTFIQNIQNKKNEFKTQKAYLTSILAALLSFTEYSPKMENPFIQSAKKAEKIIKNFKLTKLYDQTIDSKQIKWLIENLKFSNSTHIKNINILEIEKIFITHEFSKELLILLKSLGNVFAQYDINNFKLSYNLLNKKIKQRFPQKKAPKKLINGHDVKKLNIKSGPLIGKILDRIRELQLKNKIRTKKQALDYIKKNF
jgi:tRNA nucleotidyltransferase/poly(A) polymerase